MRFVQAGSRSDVSAAAPGVLQLLDVVVAAHHVDGLDALVLGILDELQVESARWSVTDQACKRVYIPEHTYTALAAMDAAPTLMILAAAKVSSEADAIQCRYQLHMLHAAYS